MCAHVLKLNKYINRLGMLGVVFPRKLAVDLVLQSLPESYSQFVKNYYMTGNNVTLIDLTYLLIASKAEMLKCNSQENMF